MALDYRLQMATPATVAQVAHELREFGVGTGVLDASVTAERLVDADGVATRLGTWIRVREEKPQPWQVVVTDLGITPTVAVVFRLGKDEALDGQQDDMIRLVAGLLDRVPGDMVLHFDFEVIWLLRRDGELSISERDDLWTPTRLAAITQRHRRATYAFS